MKKIKIEKIINIIFIFVGVLIIGLLSINIYNDFFKDKEELPKEKTLDSIELYRYTLKDNDTKVYAKEFEELRKTLNKDEIDYKLYAEELTKLFIIDFYTLSNKLTSTDIGSLEFIHPDQIENFKVNAGNTLYKYVENNIYGDRKQELPEVLEVNIENVDETKYTYKSVIYDAYKIKANWSYVKDLGYENSKEFIVIKKDSLLYIVESN